MCPQRTTLRPFPSGYAEDNMYTCSEDTQIRIKEKIQEYNLNKWWWPLVHRTHEPLFRRR